MAEDTLTVTDNRTGREYTLPITDGTIHATDLRQMSAEEGDGGLMSYDPAYLNTASCRSAITFIDGDRGILRYRGYPIEQLAEEATFLETAYLLLEGELPTADQLRGFEDEVRYHTYVHFCSWSAVGSSPFSRRYATSRYVECSASCSIG